MHRLFTAIIPPAALVADLVARRTTIPGARWQDEAQLHVTLCFLGEVDRHCAEDVAVALGQVRFAPFDIGLAGVGTFGEGHRLHSLWFGCTLPDALRTLHAKVCRACEMAGARPERRAYLPHLTVARFGRGSACAAIDRFCADHAGSAGSTFTVSHFHLMESHLGHGGARYTSIARYPAAVLG